MNVHVSFTQFAQSTPLFTLKEARDRYGRDAHSRSILNMLHRLKRQGRVRQLANGVFAGALAGAPLNRYLVPAVDVGVVFESKSGSITGEIGRVTFYSPGGPCAHCLGLVDPWRATVELMSGEEKDRRRREAREAKLRGDDAGAYWRDTPDVPTVGHFTSMVGALAASYAIGWLTGKFTPPHRYFEFNILAPNFDYVGFDAPCRSGCYCETLIGYADQGAHAALISAPPHWPGASFLTPSLTSNLTR